MITARLHRREGETVLAACDLDLVGRTLKQDVMKVSISEGFFGNEEVSEDELLVMMGQATSMNLFGEKIVALVVREGYADDDCIIEIEGVPHVQIYMF